MNLTPAMVLGGVTLISFGVLIGILLADWANTMDRRNAERKRAK